jgi:phage tail sheath protein FI
MSSELLSSKVVIEEEEPSVRGVQSAPTSVAGAVGITERGPIGVATLCNSFDEFETTFGGFTANSDLALATLGFFQNGGSELWVVRTAHYTNVAIASTVTALPSQASFTNDAQTVLRVKAQYAGSYGNRLEVEFTTASNGAAGFFNLTVFEDGSVRETFINVTLAATDARNVTTVVNDANTGSALIKVEQPSAANSFTTLPSATLLTGGTDGLTELSDADFIGSEPGKTGLRALDSVQSLSLLLVPGRATPAVHAAMLAYCEVARNGTVFAILDPPSGLSATAMVTYTSTTAALEGSSEFGAIYWPRIKILNPKKSVFGSASQIVAPPSGAIAGVYARTDSSRGGGVYDSPAGIEQGRLFEVLGFETDEVLQEAKRDLVYPHRINPLTTAPGFPRYIDGCRTLKGSGNFPYIGERRGVIFIERSLKAALEFARHKNNTAALRAQVHRTITAFLITQMNNGAFRSTEPSKAFFVDVSDLLNPPAVIFAGKLIARVGLATNKPAEFVILRIAQDTRALEAELALASS